MDWASCKKIASEVLGIGPGLAWWMGSSKGSSCRTNPNLGEAIPVPSWAHLYYILLQKAEPLRWLARTEISAPTEKGQISNYSGTYGLSSWSLWTLCSNWPIFSLQCSEVGWDESFLAWIHYTLCILQVFHTESWFFEMRWQGRGHDALGVGK